MTFDILSGVECSDKWRDKHVLMLPAGPASFIYQDLGQEGIGPAECKNRWSGWPGQSDYKWAEHISDISTYLKTDIFQGD